MTPAVTPSSDAVRKVDEACTSLARVDLARMSEPLDWTWAEELHARVRQGIEFSWPPMELTVLKVAVPVAWPSTRGEHSYWAVRTPAGRWMLSQAAFEAIPPPPQPPPAAIPVQGRSHKVGVMTEEAGRILDAALASDCLAREPSAIPAELPLKGGGTEMTCGLHGMRYAVEIIRESGKRQRFTKRCARDWASGLIIMTMENPASLQTSG